jgi:uncharacterized protein (TIGR02300 family)
VAAGEAVGIVCPRIRREALARVTDSVTNAPIHAFSILTGTGTQSNGGAHFPSGGAIAVAKPELGFKRICGSCGVKFYDLARNPIVCPKCGASYVAVTTAARAPAAAAAAAARPEPVAAAPVPVEEPELPQPAEAEIISLEEADAEATDKTKTAAPGAEAEPEEEVEIATKDVDDTFLEPEEEESGDVSDIIGEKVEEEDGEI